MFQVTRTNRLGAEAFNSYLQKEDTSVNQLINENSDSKAALATPGLLKNRRNKIHHKSKKQYLKDVFGKKGKK